MKKVVYAIRKVGYCCIFVGLFVFLAGFGGCPSGGGGGTPPPLPKDAAWCDIMAVQCAVFVVNANNIPIDCAFISLDNAGNPVRSLASAPDQGDRVCFDSGNFTPQEACAGLCSPLSQHLNPIRWPIANNLRSLCSSGLNTNAAFHGSLNAQGFEPNGCGDPGPGLPLASQGTNAITLTGAGTATLDGGNAQDVPIIGGYFNMAAPDTSCAAGETTCATQLNQAEVAFGNFSFSGHSVAGLRIFLDRQVLTSSGVFVPGANAFVFTIPVDVFFDAKATVDGSLTGLIVRSTEEVFGSIDLTTGAMAIQFDVAGPFAGQTLGISGTALTSEVTALAPVVTAAPTQEVEGTNNDCSGDVTLTATATSAAGLPVSLFFGSEDEFFGTGPSVVATLPVGTTDVQILGIDSKGMQDTVIQTVTVNDAAPPVISAPPDATITTCVNASIGTATATDGCDGPVTVTNNAPARFPPGTTIVTWIATDSEGNQATAQQRVTAILGDDPSCCPVGTNVILGTPNNDLLNGTSGSDCILGRGAQDTINGNAGNDFLSGGEGNDTINGGSGNDVIFGGSGQDPLTGGTGDDTMFGGDGDDNVQGGTGNDTLSGGQGQDTLQGQDDNDALSGNDGDDNLQGGNGNDNLVGGTNNDTCNGGTGTNTFAQCEFGAPNSCADGVQNGTETDLNCGGACPDCGSGDSCVTSNDCTSNICSSGICQEVGGGGAGTVSTSLSFSTDWGGGYCAVLNVTNNSANPTTSFTVNLDTNASTIYDSWNASFVGSSGPVSATPCCEWNRILAPGETDTSIGFCANRTVAGSGTLPFVVSTTGTF